MRRFVLLTLVSIPALVSSLSANYCFAQPPDILRQYRFLPRHSILEVEGGFAGIAVAANIHGDFLFVNGFRNDAGNLDPYAEFLRVDAVAINPTDFGPYSFDLDEALHLTGLEGEPLPVAAPFDVIKFRGEDGQGAPLQLTVIQLGRWLYMQGASDPPCCDFFKYEIDAFARQTPFADFTEDAHIDATDLAMWRRSFGLDAHGDADGDADSDGADFLDWQRQVGEEMPPLDTFFSLAAAVAQPLVATSAPEPGSFALLMVAALQAAAYRKRGANSQRR